MLTNQVIYHIPDAMFLVHSVLWLATCGIRTLGLGRILLFSQSRLNPSHFAVYSFTYITLANEKTKQNEKIKITITTTAAATKLPCEFVVIWWAGKKCDRNERVIKRVTFNRRYVAGFVVVVPMR